MLGSDLFSNLLQSIFIGHTSFNLAQVTNNVHSGPQASLFPGNSSSSSYSLDVGFPSVCYEYVLLPLVNKEAAQKLY